MADTPTQDRRIGRLATPFDKDKLCLVRFEGHEAIGELFEYRIEAVSKDANIDFNPKLGQNCSVHLETVDQAGRDFSGILTEARWVGTSFNLHRYRLILRPWPWLLSLRAQCKIFYNMSVKEIIKKALGGGSYGPIDDQTGDYPTLEYTVQYRETDLNFALRLMEKYGIYYYFTFDKGDGASPSAHQLVLADSTSYKDLPAPGSVLYAPLSVRTRRDFQSFRDWTKSQGMVAGIFELNDYNYKKPSADLLAHEEQKYPYDKGSYVYDYPGGYADKGKGEDLTQVRRDADRRGERSYASGYAPSLTPGFKIQRKSTNNDPLDDTYLILHCTHRYGDQSYVSGKGASALNAAYDGEYELCLSSIPYRMPLRTRRPVIIGTQPARVIRDEKNNPGEEIDVDPLGRILVFFYWDREKKYARRIRVAQVWAGNQRGGLFTPRVGDEVVVAYEEGDPDRPIVIGSVYNGNNTVPMTLPDKKVKSGILTLSSKGGNGYHMFLFDDTAGSEIVKLRSQKDLMFKALNNEQRDIVSSQTENVGQDETINVGFPVPPQGTGPGSGNFTLNALNTVTINVGPQGSPLTQIVMDTSSITLNVGPQGMASQIVMNMEGITLSVGPGGLAAQIQMDATGVTVSGTPASQLMVQPMGITTLTPMMTFSYGPVTFASPMVTIPLVTIGAGTASGLPII